MKPLLLEIDGLGSFENLQKIDFENLTTSGLFGIFGKTGAGKSTILDSLTLALYDQVDRYGKKDSEMVNLNRKDCYVSLMFSVKNQGEDIIYKVERGYRVDPHGNLVNKKHILSCKNGDVFEPVTEGVKELKQKLNDIISLNYEDFTKAVILPQGKFNQFINLDGRGKHRMLERIFGLEQYGKKLTEKYNKKLREVSKDRDELIRVFGEYKEYTITRKKESEKKLRTLEKELETLIEKRKNVRDIKNKVDEEIEKARNLKEVKKDLETLESNKEKIENSEKTLKTKIVVERVTELQNKVEIRVKDKCRLKKEVETLKEDAKKVNAELEQIKEELDTIDKSIGFNKKRLSEIKIDQKYVQDISFAVEKEKDVKLIEKDINNNIQEENKNKEEVKILLSENLELKKDIDLLKKEIVENTKNAERLKEDKEYWESAIKVVEKQVKNKSPFEDVKEKVYATFDEQIRIILENESNIKRYEEEILDFKIQNLALTLAEKLEEGKPCPLCGSKVHPSVVKALEEGYKETKEKQIEACKEIIIVSEKNIEKYIAGLENRISDFVEKHKKVEKAISDKNENLNTLEQEVIKNTQKIENSKSNNLKLVEKIEDLKNRINDITEELTKIKVKYNLQKTFKETSEDIEKVQQQLMTLEKIIKDEEGKQKFKADLQRQKQELVNKINIDYSSKETSFKAVLETLETLNVEINKVLSDNNLSMELLESSKKIDFDNLEQEINEHKEKLVICKDKYKELKIYETLNLEELLITLKETVENQKNIEEKIEENNKDIGSEEEKLTMFNHNLKKKEDIERELKSVEKLYNDIMSIKTLLQGERFIEFLARKDLEEVVYFASEEFNRLSNGKYFLKLSSDGENNIEVVDNLQGGKCRGIKTLSGGETFVISLCLALSLSKKIQMKKNSIIEFFFFDEGFGSLDNEALDKVTDSLMRLKGNNINIGIITHVDKLKERVPKSLYVENSANGTTVRID